MAKKSPTLNNDVPTSTAISSDTQTADYYKLIEEQQKVITRMQEKIHALEAKVYRLEGQMNVTQTANSHLSNMVDAKEQYSRRPCLVVTGMAKPGHKKGADNSDDLKQVMETLERKFEISQDVIKNNLAKMHAIGRPDVYGKQLRIVKFTTDSFKETIFRKRKNQRNAYIERQKRSGKPVPM